MATPSSAQTRLTLGNLGAVVLRHGDNDTQQLWGGQVLTGVSGTPIHELQAALASVGTLTEVPDGEFGDGTRDALQRFQWYATNLPFRLQVAAGALPETGTPVAFATPAAGSPGLCNAVTGAELVAWQTNGFMTTTPLVRMATSTLSSTGTGENFDLLSYPNATAGEILVHAEFAPVIRVLDSQAKASAVTLRINQTFRRSGVAPSGAVVTPAKKSQHLCGHAVDLNVEDGSRINTASMFASGSQTAGARRFISAVKAAGGIRWGGDFQVEDYVHFDDFLDPDSEAYDMTLFFCQSGFRARHPMRLLA